MIMGMQIQGVKEGRPAPIMLKILPINIIFPGFPKNFAHYHYLLFSKIRLTILQQVIMELNDCFIRVY